MNNNQNQTAADREKVEAWEAAMEEAQHRASSWRQDEQRRVEDAWVRDGIRLSVDEGELSDSYWAEVEDVYGRLVGEEDAQ